MALYEPGPDDVPLGLVALGVVADDPVLPDLQPRLPDGIHLRWGFRRVSPNDPDADPTENRAFPWYGYYLFRRPTPFGSGGATNCISSAFAGAGLIPGTLSTNTLSIAGNTFSSDQNLVLTDTFAPSGTVEFDLANRTFLKLAMYPFDPRRSVDVKIGFLADFPPPGGGPSGGGGGSGSGDDGHETDGGLGDGNSGGDPRLPDPPTRGPDDPTGGMGDQGGDSGQSGDDGGSTGDSGDGGMGDRGSRSVVCACGCGASASVRPTLERVISLGDGRYRATFGYTNPGGTAISIPIGPQNRFSPDPESRGQPTLFLPGTHHGAFTVDFSGGPLVWLIGGFTSATASSASATAPTAADGILVIALRGGLPVGLRVVSGKAGDVKTATITFDAFDTIVVTGGPACLVDVCSILVSADQALGNWTPVPNFPQPMLLPIKSDFYPLSPGPEDVAGSQATATGRVSYAFPVPGSSPPVLDTTQWQGDNFAELHALLKEIVDVGPTKGLMDHVDETVTADADPDDPSAIRPVATKQSSLDALLLGAANPAVAQMLGLYWIDTMTVEGQSYDYLLVADDLNVGAGNVSTIQTRMNAGNYDDVEAYQRSGVVLSRPLPLAVTPSPDAYALPIAAPVPPTPADAAGAVGLRWQITGTTELTRLISENPIMFHTWRRGFGVIDPGDTPDATGYGRVTDDPRAPGDLRVEPVEEPLTGWPSVGLYFVDEPLIEGWYGYRVSGIDVFGRHSALSEPARWLDPDTSLTRPAVHLVDRVPPPPPSRVQAWVLDPLDTFLFKDAAYDAWFNALPDKTVIGLRVRWSWPSRAIVKAPDALEFRVYVNPGTALTDAAVPLSWSQRIAIVGIAEQIIVDETVPVKNGSSQILTGANATIQALPADAPPQSQEIVATLADGPALDLDMVAEGLELELADVPGGAVRVSVLGVDPAAKTLRLTQNPGLTGTSAWTLFRERTYELFLPGTSLATPPPPLTLPTTPSETTAVAFGLVGVSAADDKDRPDPRALLPGPLTPRAGNEGDVGGPATVYQVWRTQPSRPVATYTDPKLFATRADFRSRSFFTVHVSKLPNLLIDVFRAMDDTLFQVDIRKGFAPDGWNDDLLVATEVAMGWQAQPGRYTAAKNQILALNSKDDYLALSDDALRLLASFPSNDDAFSRITNPSLTPDTPDGRGPSDPDGYGAIANLGAYTDTVDGRARNRYFYRSKHVSLSQVEGDLGPSTPPVYLPPASLPTAPGLVGAAGADRKITLSILAAADPATTQYRIYRGDGAAAGRDIRLMVRIATVTDTRPPANRTAPLPFDDTHVVPYQDYTYRVTALSSDGTESLPSPALGTRAFDNSPPPEPTWERSEWVKLDAGGVEHPFTSTAPSLIPVIAVRLSYDSLTVARALLRSVVGTGLRTVSPWLLPSAGSPGQVVASAHVRGLDPTVAQSLRARAVNRGGIEALSAPREVPVP